MAKIESLLYGVPVTELVSYLLYAFEPEAVANAFSMVGLMQG